MATKRYWLAITLISSVFLVLYLIVEGLKIPVLSDPSPFLNAPGIITALGGIIILILDVLLPVPSSFIMVANGALFGIFLGTLLSLVGRTSAFFFGYYLGTKALPYAKRFISEKEMAKANSLLEKWGVLAIVLTRPLPILSETMAVTAGFSSIPLKRSLVAASLGSLPEAFLFAATGAVAASLNNIVLIFLATLLLAAVFYLFSRARRKKE